MKKLYYGLSFILMLLTIGTCREPEYDYFGTISGVVTDAQTHSILSGVKVSLSPGGISQLTSDDGTFTFEDLEPQEYTLTFIKDGYTDMTQKVSVMSGEPSTVQVVMEALLPELMIEQDILDFGRDSSTLVIDIINNGANELEWEISENIEWLTCEPSSGTTTSESTPVVFTASRTGMRQGEYNESLVISSNGGSETVEVHLTVSDMRLNVTPDILDFGTLLSSIEMTLENTSGRPMEWSATIANDWLVLSKSSGTISGKDLINAIAIRDGLSAGTYNSSISFLMDGGETVIPVKMSVAVNEKPTITIETVSGITYNSATITGTIVSPGSSKISRYGFCWSEHEEPTVDDYFSNLGDCSAPTAFEGSATDLKPETKYYVRAYAENSVGLVYSESELSFTSSKLPELPEVKNGGISGITSTSAKATGTVESFGNVLNISAYGHVWSESPTPTLETGQSTDLGETSEEPTDFVSELTDLKPHTLYYVRSYATNEIGTAYSADSTFETAKTDVILTTLEVTDIIHDAATCGGSILDDGGHVIAEKGICWSTSPIPTVEDNNMAAQSEDFICRMTGLEKETDYYVRAYVRTSEDIIFYGDERQFRTTKEIVLPELGDVEVSDIEINSATVISSVISDGNTTVLSAGFCFSINPAPTIETGTVLQCDPASQQLGKKLTELNDGTTYYIRSFATNIIGTGYSNELSFTTKAITPPELSNVSVSNIGRTTANVAASIISNGNADVTECGFCWATNPYPTIFDNKVICETGMTFSTTLQNLPSLTDVYVRAYAINSKGTSYSVDATFTTSDSDTDVWDGSSTASGFGGGVGSSALPIIINSAGQLKLLANNVNNGTTYSGVYFILETNIDLAGKTWIPIGNSNNSFQGHFIGNNKSVINVNVESGRSYSGLFGKITNGTISDLNVSGIIGSGNDYVGLLSGYAEGNAMFSNVSISGSVSGNTYVGGLIGGCNDEVQIINSENYATVKGYRQAGGIIGTSASRSIIVTNCINYGYITSTYSNTSGSEYAGGIVGAGSCTVLNCCNYSNITGGVGIIGGRDRISVQNCFWLNDIVSNQGVEKGVYSTNLENSSNFGYYVLSSGRCILMQLENKDLVETLNEWVDNNDPVTYFRWSYGTRNGNACPVLVKQKL